MIEWIVSSTVLVAVVIALRIVLKGKISLRLQYALWGLVLVRLLLPISIGNTAISVTNGLTSTTTEQPIVLGYVGAETPDLAIVEPDSNLSPAEQEIQYEINRELWQAEMDIARAETGTPITLSTILMIVWVAGAILLCLWFLFTNLRFWGMLKRTRHPLAMDGYKSPVYISEHLDTPCLFGLFPPAIYLTPEAVEDDITLRHTIQHELTHYRHGDHIWALFRGLALALHWYNPLVWWGAVLSSRDGELACDESTILNLGEEERAQYGRTLITMTCQKRPTLLLTATTMTGGKKSLKERITLIAKKPKMARYTLVAVMAITLVATLCTFTGAALETIVEDLTVDVDQSSEDMSSEGYTVTTGPAAFYYYDENAVAQVASHQGYIDVATNAVTAGLMTQYGYSEDEVETLLLEGGLQIFTCMDPAMQEIFDTAGEAQNQISDSGQPLQSAMVLLDNATGQVLALYGGTTSDGLNRATEVMRQPGTALTPLSVYTPTIELAHMTPDSLVSDQPDETGFPANPYGSYQDEMTLTEALSMSSYCVPVGLINDQLGLEESAQFIQETYPIKLVIDQEYNGYQISDVSSIGLALGGLTYGVTPLELAASYTIFPSDGAYTAPTFYTHVLDHEGKVLLYADTTSQQVVQEATANTMTELLQEVMSDGVGAEAYIDGLDVAGTPGSNASNTDMWFVGYTSELTAVVWNGYDSYEPITDTDNPSAVAWKQVMQAVYEN